MYRSIAAYTRLYLKGSLALLVSGTMMFSSCKKETPQERTAPNVNRSSPPFDPTGVDAGIKLFYAKMKSISGGGPAAGTISADNAVFLIEGTYNKYVAERQFNCDVVYHTFNVKVPARVDGSIELAKVSEAFYTIKSIMLDRMTMLGDVNGVESFELDVVARPTGGELSYEFGATTYYKRPNPGFPIDMTEWCNDDFHDADNFVFASRTSSDPTLGYPMNGQALIDHSTKNLVPGSLDNSLPGAAGCLRGKGIGNYRDFYCRSYLCGYYVNIVTPSAAFYMTYPASPLCEYVSMAIPEYENTNIWKAKVYTSGSSDPYNTYRHYLTTPMMNHYLAYIPGLIEDNIVAGKEFANFHIQTEAFLYSGYSNYAHWYRISSGDFVPTPEGDCTGKLELGYL